MKRNDSENGHVSSFAFWSSHKYVFIYVQAISINIDSASGEISRRRRRSERHGGIFSGVWASSLSSALPGANELPKLMVGKINKPVTGGKTLKYIKK